MRKTVLIYSGGMDSWLIDKLINPDIRLFVKINTRNNDLEYEYLMKKDSKELENVKIVEFNLGQFEQVENNYFLPLRNLYLVALASNFGDKIVLGAVKGSVHLDNNPYFCSLTSRLMTYLLSEKVTKEVTVVTPFVDHSKTDLLKLYLDQGGDIVKAYNETASCYQPVDGKECLSCSSCASKFTAFYNNGYPFTPEEIEKFLVFVENNAHLVEADVSKLYWVLAAK